MRTGRAPGRGALQWTGWLSGALALLAVVLVVVHLGDVRRFVHLAESLAPEWLVAAVALQAATYVCVAGAWRIALRPAGVRVGFRPLLALALQKLFVDQSVPSGGMSGNAYLVTALVGRGARSIDCLSALLAGLVAHYGAYLVAAATGVAALMQVHAWRRWMGPIAAAFCLVCLAMPAGLLVFRTLHAKAPAWARRVPGVATLLDAYGHAPTTLLRRPGLLLRMTAAESAIAILDAATLWVMLRAIGADTPFLAAYGSHAMATMVAMLGPVPLGLGTFEAACVATLTAAGTPLESALVGTLLARGWMTWLPMLPGLLLVRRELHNRKRVRGAAAGGTSI